MGKSKDNLSISDWAPSKRWGAKVLYAALLSLKENGGELPIDSVLASVEKNVLLDEWAKEQYQKTGYIRWQSLLHFFSIDAVKSGFLVKKKGVWYLTPEGEKTLTKGEAELFIAAQAGYKKWRANNPKAPDQNTKMKIQKLSLNSKQTLHMPKLKSEVKNLSKTLLILKMHMNFKT